MTNQVHPFKTERVEQAECVGNERGPAIGAELLGTWRVTESAEVGCDDAEAPSDEGGHLMPPEEARVGEAVQHEHCGPFPNIHDGKNFPGHFDVPADLFQIHPSTYCQTR